MFLPLFFEYMMQKEFPARITVSRELFFAENSQHSSSERDRWKIHETKWKPKHRTL